MNLRVKPCHCGWKYPGFHICVNLSTYHPDEGKIEVVSKRDRRYPNRSKPSMFSEEHREAISNANHERWARYQKSQRKRNQKIVQMYSEGEKGMRTIAQELGLAYHIVQRILKDAETEGLITIRPRGRTIQKGG